MDGFLYETHCHTREVSRCSKISAKDIVKAYIKAGYDGVVITDHFAIETFLAKKNIRTSEIADYYLKGYKAALKAARGRINVILGMEITFYENKNDYLVYGVTEDFINEYPNIMDMGIEKFSELAHKNGMVIFQAHPFREHMSITNPDLLDGYEVYNGNRKHYSNNSIASAWAKNFSKKALSGSDCHKKEDFCRGGIIIEQKAANSVEFADAIMNGKVEIIERGRI